MRSENLPRLSSFGSIDVNDPNFLHYRTLHKALFDASKYAVGHLIDIGCGNKPYEKCFKSVTAYIGCDVAQSSLQRADVISSATSLPFKSESFDVAFSTQVIEHVAEYPMLLEEAFRLLKSKGYLIVAGPMYWPLHEEPYDFFRFTKYGFRHILEKAGFEVVDVVPNGGKWSVLGQVFVHTLQDTRFYRRPIIRLSNKVFAWLDDRKFDEVSTINYVAVAIKP